MSSRLKLMLPFVLALAAFAPAGRAAADGLIVVDRPTTVPHGHYRFAPLEVREHQVNVTIRDQVAVTSIDQVFYNPNRQQLEGTYLFPIPRNAQIDKFSMDVNGVQMQAELLDAQKARKIYEDIVRSMRDPALLEYVGQELFKVRIFPLEAQKEKRIKISYTQVLPQDTGLTEYLYPLNTEKFSAAPIRTVSLKIDIETAGPIDSIYCPSHSVEVRRTGDNTATVGFEASDVRPDTDFKLYFSTAPSGDAPVGMTLLTHRPDTDEDGYFLLLVSPQHAFSERRVAPKDIVFVLDTSGSMAGEKLEQAKAAMRFCLDNLNDKDRFEVIRFSTESQALFEGLTPVSEESIATAGQFVKGLKPMGGTAIDDALQEAVRVADGRLDHSRSCMVIFLTDGRPTIGSTDEQQILSNLDKALGERNMRYFCFGIGADINTHLLDRIAENTRAVPQYVLPDEDIEIKVSNFYAKVDSPVMVDPKLRFNNGVKALAVHPGQLPDVFKGDQLMVFGRYSGSGDAAVMLDGMVEGNQRTVVYEGSFAVKETENTFIARLWATRRVGYLLDMIRMNGESSELRDEVIRLARRFGIVTPYTAYLIVEDEARRDVPLWLRSVTRSLDRAGRMMQEGDAMYRSLATADSGLEAVEASKSMRRMRGAGQAERANAQAGAGGGGDVLVLGGEMQLTDKEQDQLDALGVRGSDARHVGGRTFYRNTSDVWIDALIQHEVDRASPFTRVKVAFASELYFDLLGKHEQTAKWLSLGERVHILIGETVYEISAAEE